jgi:chromosome segregation ATPase
VIRDIVELFVQFGVAGLMGALWVWERTLTGKRERQLNDTHNSLMAEREQMKLLVRLVRRTTRAIERFDRTLDQLRQTISQQTPHGPSLQRSIDENDSPTAA